MGRMDSVAPAEGGLSAFHFGHYVPERFQQRHYFIQPALLQFGLTTKNASLDQFRFVFARLKHTQCQSKRFIDRILHPRETLLTASGQFLHENIGMHRVILDFALEFPGYHRQWFKNAIGQHLKSNRLGMVKKEMSNHRKIIFPNR